VAEDMGVDWGQAFHIGGAGFGTVFLVLIILAGVVSLIALAVKRISRGKGEANSAQRKD